MANIVIIDGDRVMSEFLKECLSEAGYKVRAPASCDAPLPLKANLVIIDLYMPRHGGHAFVQRIRRLYPDTPIIALSCQFHAGLCGTGAVARDLCVEAVIAKPFMRDRLLNAVRALIGVRGKA